VTAAFGRLFNHELHGTPEERDSQFRKMSPDEQRRMRQDFLNRRDTIFAEHDAYSGDTRDAIGTSGKVATALGWLGRIPGWIGRAINFGTTAFDVSLGRNLDDYWAAENSYEAWSGDVSKANWFASKGFLGRDWAPYNVAGSPRLSVDFYYYVTDQVKLRPPTCAIERRC
jgi:hypothetical protein